MSILFGSSNVMGALSVLALILSIAAVVLAFIFIVPEKKRAGLNKLGKALHDLLNFKYLIIEKILQALYIFFTAYVILTGFFMLFIVTDGYYSSNWLGGQGLLLMIVGPIAIRLAYELLMMAILLVKNVISINNKLKNQNDDNNKKDIFGTPDFSDTFGDFADAPAQSETEPVNTAVQPEAAPETSVAVCPNCGAPVGDATFCSQCGTKVK